MSQSTSSVSTFQAVINEMEQYLAQNTHPRSLHEVEADLFAMLMKAGRAALASYVEGVGDGRCGPRHTDEASQTRPYHSIKTTTYRSIFGPISIQRAYYYHPDRGGICPLDAALSLPEHSYSYLLQRWVTLLAVKDPYDDGLASLTELLGIRFPKERAEAMVVAAAKDVSPFREQHPAPERSGKVLVIQVDGKGIRMAKPRTDEPGPKMRLKKGEKRNRKKMAHLFTVYALEPEAGCAPAPIERKVYAYMGPKRAAFEAFRAEAVKRGYGRISTLFLSDGDHDLAKLQGEFFPEAEPCVDWIHVVEYLWKAAYVFHPEGSPAAVAWVREREKRLLEGDVSTLLRGLRQSLTKGAKLKPSQRETLRTVIGYLHGVRDRIPYREWYAAGYPIATGSVEGACRHLVEDRMERAGMKWKEPGAQAILDLRYTHENGEWDEFMRYRIRREHQRLYGRPLPEAKSA